MPFSAKIKYFKEVKRDGGRKDKDLWVFIETEDEGTAKSVGLELLVPGRRLADKQNGKLVAVILGSNVAPALEAVVVL